MIDFGFIQVSWRDEKAVAEPNSLAGLVLSTYLNHRLPNQVETTIVEELDHFESKEFDLIGISSVSENYFDAIKIARQIREISDIPIMIGGIHISLMPQDLHKVFDLAVIGEGELTIVELISIFEEKGALSPKHISGVKGIAFHNGDRIVINPKRELIMDLNDIPVPDYESIDASASISPRVIASRGCPYNCKICSQKSLWNGSVRFYDMESIIRQIRNIRRKYPHQAVIGLEDDLFFVSKKRVKAFLHAIKKEEFYGKVEFDGFIRSNLVDEEMCQLLKEIGINFVAFGFETASDRLLKHMNKQTTLKDHLRAFELLAKYDIRLRVPTIVGFPTETEADIRQSFDIVGEMLRSGKCDFNEVQILCPYPGSFYWQDALDTNKISIPFDYRNFRYFGYLESRINGLVKSAEEWIQLREHNDCSYIGDLPKETFYNLLRELLPSHEELHFQHSSLFSKRLQAVNIISHEIDSKSDDTRYAIYGTGFLTKDILPRLDLTKGRFMGFIDSDMNKRGKFLADYEIMAPDDIPSQDLEVIFVSAMTDLSKNAIIKKIKSIGYTGGLQPLI